MWRHARLGVALVYAVACTNVVGPPAGSRPFQPPARFRAWWALTESWSGLSGNFNSVKWYTLPNSDTFSLEGSTVNGAWYSNGNQIVLGDSEITDGALVRHEMLHALLRSAGHPRGQFLGNCSDIVVCIDRCVEDAGGPPDTSGTAPLLGGSAFTLSTRIVPDTVSLAADSGLFTVTIEITNTTPMAARVRVPMNGGVPYTLVQCVYPSDWPDDGGAVSDLLNYYVTVAPSGTPGATRRVVFDQYSDATPTLPDAFTFTGAFAGHPSPPRSLLVVR
jgi:hypothetical protein